MAGAVFGYTKEKRWYPSSSPRRVREARVTAGGAIEVQMGCATVGLT